MKVKRIKETCLYVADLHRTRDFYEGKLGLECMTLDEGRHVFFRAGDSVLLCFNPEDSRTKTHLPPHWGKGVLHLAFDVAREDYEGWKEKVSAAGIPITHEQDWGRGILSFYFDDPDGHCIEILMEGLWDPD